MSAKKPITAPVVSVYRSADARMALVYAGPALVATLKRDGLGWTTAFYRSGTGEDGCSVWTLGPDREPVALTAAADQVARLIEQKTTEVPMQM